MAEFVGRMRAAARQAGIDDDGPLTPLLDAFMLTLDRLGALTDRNARISTDHAAALDTALTLARQAANAETDRFYASLDAAKAETVRDVAQHIARSADAALRRRVQVFDRNTALVAAESWSAASSSPWPAATGGATATPQPAFVKPRSGCRPPSATGRKPRGTGST